MSRIFKLIIFVIIVVVILEYFKFIAPVTPLALSMAKHIMVSLIAQIPNIPPIRIPTVEFTTQNILLLLLLLFLISYFSEKFRYFTNSIAQLTRKLKHLKAELDFIKNSGDDNTNTSELVQQATLIRELLEKLSKNTNLENQSVPIRAKKVRRVDSDTQNETEPIKKPVRKKKASKKKVLRKKTSKLNLVEKDEPSTDEIMSDENISQVDLARALIESKDVSKAKELLVKIVDSGTEQEKHEARLLYLNLDDR
ncbi:MAG: hypothetical protein CMD88_01385 [Gammaproteobacteria bacterium]|nr:hypothetical protein [Gammaproteobacteria bacterium]|tara:strand:- start:3403 stop:4161 length:759 start_codon:yes stop_codon:yes gene_type:complete